MISWRRWSPDCRGLAGPGRRARRAPARRPRAARRRCRRRRRRGRSCSSSSRRCWRSCSSSSRRPWMRSPSAVSKPDCSIRRRAALRSPWYRRSSVISARTSSASELEARPGCRPSASSGTAAASTTPEWHQVGYGRCRQRPAAADSDGEQRSARCVGGPAPAASLLSRLERWRPSSTNSTAEATAAGDSSLGELGRRPRAGPGSVGDQLGVGGRGDVLAGVHDRALLEGVEHAGAGSPRSKRSRKTVRTAALQELLDDLLVAALLERLDLDLARGRRGQRVEVADAGHDVGLARGAGPGGWRWPPASRSWRPSAAPTRPSAG